MKYAYMSSSCPNWTLDEMIARARDYGYAGLELRIGWGHAFGLDVTSDARTRAAARRTAEAAGIALCCVATGAKTADPATASLNVSEAEPAIDLAADLGAPLVRVFGGMFPESITREQAMNSVIKNFGALAKYAGRKGVTIVFETHDAWTDPHHVAEVLWRVSHPNLQCNWDYQHTTRVAKVSVDEAFGALKPFIKHVHFHDGSLDADKLVFLPVGQGHYDHKRVLQLLRSMNYTGFISGEWINWEPPEMHLPREVAAMKQIEAAL